MAPSIHWRSGNDVFDAHTAIQPETRDATDNTMQPWIIVVIVLGTLVSTSSIVFLVLYLSRRRRRNKRDNQGPLVWRGHKRGKMSESDRLAAEEIERATMIRKSLASRSSVGTRNSQESGLPDYHQLEQFDREEREERGPIATRDKNNWKEIEAGRERQASVPGIQNTEMGVHPALLPQPQLAIPAPSRAPSPYRGPQPPRLFIPS
ncbi:hypothetical protein F5Y06DRAFT_157437 [Hypoxylon sp. FL0890]|nr:hypothetical protein F5Y06DRAFT_157437 [Hypoxylon sp. FL0890]